jgi:hypothetical protein
MVSERRRSRFKVIQCAPGGRQSRLELLLGVRSLHLGQLAVHVGVGCGQVLLGRSLLHNLLHDQLVQDVELQCESSWSVVGDGCCWGLLASCAVVDLVHIGAQDRLSVDGSDNAILRALAATGEQCERRHDKNGWYWSGSSACGRVLPEHSTGGEEVESNLSRSVYRKWAVSWRFRRPGRAHRRPWNRPPEPCRKRARSRCRGSSSA